MSTPATLEATTSIGYTESNSISQMGDDYWIGEWSYYVRSQVHSFTISNRRGQLVYEEVSGSTKMTGKATATSETCLIKCKKMNFEIELNRESQTARYRQKGLKKRNSLPCDISARKSLQKSERSLRWFDQEA